MSEQERSTIGNAGAEASGALKTPVVWRAFLIPVLLGLGAILYAQNVWEDYLITFRFSRNLAIGNGLVFTPGERVHGFTSPINTLLPALFDWMSGSKSILPALRGYQAVSLVAFGMAGVWVLRAMRVGGATGAVAWLGWVAVWMMALEPKSLLYSVNGQEAGFLLMFSAWGLWAAVVAPNRAWLHWAGVFAGLQYTRPDGVMYCAAIGIAALVFAADRRTVFRSLLGGIGLSVLVYLPWVIFAWSYYGSPVPHTVLAKGAGEVGPKFAGYPKQLWQAIGLCADAIYAHFFPWDGVWRWPARVMGVVGVLWWIIPGGLRVGRIASLTMLLGCLYLGMMPTVYSWYLVIVAMMMMVVWACVVADVGRWTSKLAGAKVGRVVMYGLAGVLLVRSVWMGAVSVDGIRIQQDLIENKLRRPMGEWLGARVKPEDRIFIECLGYVGFYSQARMLDFPGLASPATVEARRRTEGGTMHETMAELMPEWAVLRRHELQAMHVHEPEAIARYRQVIQFDVRPLVEPIWGHPVFNYLAFDAHFIVLRRDDVEERR